MSLFLMLLFDSIINCSAPIFHLIVFDNDAVLLNIFLYSPPHLISHFCFSQPLTFTLMQACFLIFLVNLKLYLVLSLFHLSI